MEIKVREIYDVSQIEVPKELGLWKVSDEQMDAQLKVLARLAAQDIPADKAQAGDCVRCICLSGELEGREVLLYPGMKIPGAEQAEAAVEGCGAGDVIHTVLNGDAELQIREILRRKPAEVDDALIESLCMEGVGTLEAYRAWYKKTTAESNQTQAVKQIQNYMLDELAARSVVEADEAEMERGAEAQARQRFAFDMETGGMQMELTDEMLEELKQESRLQMRRDAVEKAFCEEQGFTFTPDMFEEEMREIAEMMPGMDDMLDEYRSMYVQSAYSNKARELLEEQAKSWLEVE